MTYTEFESSVKTASPRILITLLFSLSIMANFLSACIRTEELKFTRIAALKIAPYNTENTGQLVQGKLSGKVAYNFPIKPPTDGSVIYIADPERGLVRVFNLGENGELVKLIGGVSLTPPEGVKHIPVQPGGVPGWISPDDDGKIYVQFRRLLTPPAPAGDKKKKKKDQKVVPAVRRSPPQVFKTDDRQVPPSWIYQIDSDDQIIYKLGVQGADSEQPFGLIYRMEAGFDDVLFVIHREDQIKALSIYKEGKRIAHYTVFSAPAAGEAKKYLIETEEIYPDPSGEYILASTVYREKKTHKPVLRKIYRLTDPETAPVLLTTIEDMGDYFAWGRPDGGYYLMREEDEGAGITFKVYNKEGKRDPLNRRMHFPGLRSTWREPFPGNNGKIYTSRLYQGKLELYEWE